MKVAEILHDILREKTKRNSSYSLRAMARDLGVTHGFLSLLLAGKKKLTFRRAVEFSQILGIDEARMQLLLRSVALEATKDAAGRAYLERALEGARAETGDGFAILEIDRFKILSEWYHVAILDLTQVKGFESDCAWIAEQLGISLAEAKNAVARLERLGLLETDASGRWRKTSAKLAVPTTYSDKAIREFHAQMIDKAREALQSSDPEDFAARDITGATIPIDPARLPEAKRRIQKFRRELMDFLSEGECTELYQLNIQVFRLTRKSLNSKKSRRRS